MKQPTRMKQPTKGWRRARVEDTEIHKPHDNSLINTTMSTSGWLPKKADDKQRTVQQERSLQDGNDWGRHGHAERPRSNCLCEGGTARERWTAAVPTGGWCRRRSRCRNIRSPRHRRHLSRVVALSLSLRPFD